MNKLTNKFNNIGDKKTELVFEICHIENMLQILEHIDDEKNIKVEVFKTPLKSIEYRINNINKILEEIDKLTFL